MSEMHNSKFDQELFSQSEWIAKKGSQQVEKQISLLLNRIDLLKTEEEKTLKRLNDTQLKTQKLINIKKSNQKTKEQVKIITKKKEKESLKKKKKRNQNNSNDQQFLHQLQKRNFQAKKEQQKEREAIRNALFYFKKQERDEIRKQKEKNEQKIQDLKKINLTKNKDKHDNVKEIQKQCKSNISKFWCDYTGIIHQESSSRKNKHIQLKGQNEIVLEKLEKQEFDLMNNLELSQNFHFSAKKMLEDIYQMPNSEVAKMYPGDSYQGNKRGKKDLLESSSSVNFGQSRMRNN